MRTPRPRPARLPLAALAAGLGIGACSLPGGQSPRERNEAINRDLLDRLLEGDAVTPVADFDEDAYFEELEELYRDAEPPAAPSGEKLDARGAFDLGDPTVGPDPVNPYLEFGQNIWVDEATGIVLKPYAFPVGMGPQVLNMLRTYGDFDVQVAVTDGQGLPSYAEQRPDAAVLDLHTEFDAEAFTPPRNSGLVATAIVPLSDVLWVRARPEVLFEVEYAIDLFSADTRQIEIEAKIVEVRTSDSLDIGVRRLDDTTPIFALPSSGTLINSIDYSFPNVATAEEALFSLGSVFDGVEFNAILEMVADYENVSIISRPKVAVREGAQADIVNLRKIPYFDIKSISAQGSFQTGITEREIGVQMYIIPRIIGERTIILNIDVEVSQETGTAATFAQGSGDDASVLTVPEISTRAARTIVRLEPGQAVILGGLISERSVERTSKIPILGDIPLLGYLFKSEFTEKEQTNVLFFIRPRILQGADLSPDF